MSENSRKKYQFVAHTKCPHLSHILDCNAGGFGTLECMRPDFHEKCSFRARHEEKIRNRSGIGS